MKFSYKQELKLLNETTFFGFLSSNVSFFFSFNFKKLQYDFIQ